MIKRKSKRGIFLNGLIFKNSLLSLAMGICPALSMTTSVNTAFAMGLCAFMVLFFSNIAISALKRIIPNLVRIPCSMAIIAGFVSITRYVVKAYFPALDDTFGIYLPLMVVNCMIWERAESFASKNSIINSIVDALGCGIGYIIALVLVAAIREGLGTGYLSQIRLGFVKPMTIFLLAPGGLFVMGILMAAVQKLNFLRQKEEVFADCKSCPAAVLCKDKEGGCLK